MIKDVEWVGRLVLGFSKNPEIDGEEVKISFKLKPLDLKWLQKLFNVDPNHPDLEVIQLLDKDFPLSKDQYEAMLPYMIGEPVSYDAYNFVLNSGAGSLDKWDWKTGRPVQIKNAIKKIEPLFKTIAEPLSEQYWKDFYAYLWNYYPFNELSCYRIDWETEKNYKKMSWITAINSTGKLKQFIKEAFEGKFNEVVIAYGTREPVILMSMADLVETPLITLFDDSWGACFIVGANRNKKGEIEMDYGYFIEVDCGDYLFTPC